MEQDPQGHTGRRLQTPSAARILINAVIHNEVRYADSNATKINRPPPPLPVLAAHTDGHRTRVRRPVAGDTEMGWTSVGAFIRRSLSRRGRENCGQRHGEAGGLSKAKVPMDG